MNNDCLIFNYSHKEGSIIYYGTNLEEQPYIYSGKLYFPKSLIIKYMQNFSITKNENNRIINNKNNKTSQEKSFLENLKNKEPSGLVNTGGICYMNALLQCFYYCYPMTEYFLSLKSDSFGDSNIISKGYFDFVNKLYHNNPNAANNFKKAVMMIDKSFIGNEGKDSKDLLILILSEMHQDFKKNSSVLYSDKIENNPNDKFSVYKEKLELEKINDNNTIISNTFFYDVLYEQKCSSRKINCEYTQLSFDVQSDNIIVFEMEKIYKKMNKGYSAYPSISIEDCLNNYSKEEIIECPFCNTKTLITKKSICSLPKILIFVMSRGKNAKFKCKINFKEKLDMNKFYHPVDEKYRTYDTIYHLIGTTLAFDWYNGSGHTIAFCRTYKNNEYYIFNDIRTRQSDISEIKDKVPYILFYEQIVKK